MFAVGDIVSIYAPTVGYNKYHLCIKIGEEDDASRFIFMNSESNYDGTYAVECSRVPCLPPSRTDMTAFSFTMIPRYNSKQLKSYNAKKLGTLDPSLAAELYTFAQSVKSLPKKEKEAVLFGLSSII